MEKGIFSRSRGASGEEGSRSGESSRPFTPDQMQQLMHQFAALLNQKPKETKINGMCLNSIYLSDQWVLNSGVTDHMTGIKLYYTIL
jgi:hypothetical protein